MIDREHSIKTPYKMCLNVKEPIKIHSKNVSPFILFTLCVPPEQNALFKRKVRAVPKKCVHTAAYNSGAQLPHGLCIGIVFCSFSLIIFIHALKVAEARLHCIWVKPSYSLFNLNSYIMELTLTLDHFELDDKVSWKPGQPLMKLISISTAR